MGGIAAIAAVAVLGDGSLAAADVDPTAPRDVDAAPRPRIVGVVADSVAPELEVPIATRVRGPAGRFVAARLFDGAARELGADPRATEPVRVIGLVEPRPAAAHPWRGRHDRADRRRRRLAALAGPAAEHWVVPGRRPQRQPRRRGRDDYERRVTDFLRLAFRAGAARMSSRPGPAL